MDDQDDTLARVTVTSAVTERIRRKILTGAIQEGELIRQENLATEMGVSRLPIREALHQLSVEGLVTILPHRQARVSVITPEVLTELVELRLWIEPNLVRLAIQAATKRQIAVMERILEEFKDSPANDNVALTDINRRLHVSFCAPAGRPRALELIETLLQNMGRCRIKMMSAGGDQQASLDHDEILNCFRCRDPEKGASLVRKHIVDWHNFVKSLDLEATPTAA